MKKSLIFPIFFLLFGAFFIESNAMKRKKRPQRHVSKRKKLIKTPCINQGDEWRCGYFATFNLIQMFKALSEEKSLDSLRLDKKETEFKAFIKFITKRFPDIAEKHLQEEWLSTYDIEKILCLCFSDNDELIDKDELINISIIAKELFNYDELPIGKILRENILDFRENGSTQFVIVLKDDHLAAHVFTKECIYTTNSLPSFNKSFFPFIRELHKYFTSQNMPNLETIRFTRKKIEASLKTKGKLSQIKAQAIRNGISEKQFDYMLKEIKKQFKAKPIAFVDLTDE